MSDEDHHHQRRAALVGKPEMDRDRAFGRDQRPDAERGLYEDGGGQHPGRARNAPVVDVVDDVESGSSLSEALGRHPKVFSRLYVNMVKAGEAGGALEIILQTPDAFTHDDALGHRFFHVSANAEKENIEVAKTLVMKPNTFDIVPVK